ncbi:hypothetical protein B0T11DRAFT_271121 [Plectosphaerella cucumerina]|uniref:BZIP domain-containing protein n=1 Tax=Plectosphaerella cucumerina TaxID=40658 RepID=A0A8K0TVF5_9PEZI|nr:hypothetical protein B0T11DRAFT_271121 [Plectosphaerella cucumerina]
MERTLTLLPPPPRRVGGDCPPRTEVDAEAEAEARARVSKHRRKMQNRKNQRAHRLRNKAEKEAAGSGQTSRPFQVARWRLDEADELPSSSSAVVVSYADEVPLSPPTLVFPLSTDHLLHLVQYNVFRAFVANKRTLNTLLTGWAAKTGTPASLSSCPIGGPYRDDTSVYPLNPNIPASLFPTYLQQTTLHSFWINLFPFPGVRDNLIRRDGSFDHWELLQDLIGEFMIPTRAQKQQGTPVAITVSNPKPKRGSRGGDSDEGVDDEVTTGRKGLVVWGEPHDIGSWEATPGFLAKWSWAVAGCYDLLAATNRWRMKRGEDPICLP